MDDVDEALPGCLRCTELRQACRPGTKKGGSCAGCQRGHVKCERSQRAEREEESPLMPLTTPPQVRQKQTRRRTRGGGGGVQGEGVPTGAADGLGEVLERVARALERHCDLFEEYLEFAHGCEESREQWRGRKGREESAEEREEEGEKDGEPGTPPVAGPSSTTKYNLFLD